MGAMTGSDWRCCHSLKRSLAFGVISLPYFLKTSSPFPAALLQQAVQSAPLFLFEDLNGLLHVPQAISPSFRRE